MALIKLEEKRLLKLSFRRMTADFIWKKSSKRPKGVFFNKMKKVINFIYNLENNFQPLYYLAEASNKYLKQ